MKATKTTSIFPTFLVLYEHLHNLLYSQPLADVFQQLVRMTLCLCAECFCLWSHSSLFRHTVLILEFGLSSPKQGRWAVCSLMVTLGTTGYKYVEDQTCNYSSCTELQQRCCSWLGSIYHTRFFHIHNIKLTVPMFFFSL